MEEIKKNKGKWEDGYIKIESKIAMVSSPGERRTYCVNSRQICTHKCMI